MNHLLHEVLSLLYSADPPGALKFLYNFDNVWLPSKFAGESEAWQLISNLSGKLFARIGMAILLVVTVVKYIQRFSESKVHRVGEVVRILIPSLIVGTIIASFGLWTALCKNLILGSCELMTSAIKDAALAGGYEDFMTSLEAASETNYTIGQHLTSIISMPASLLLLFASSILSFAIAWSMNLYVSVMWTLLFTIGPALFPFIVYEGTAAIGWSWFRSLLSFSFMGIVGSIIQGLLLQSNLLTFANVEASTGAVLTGTASAIVYLVCLIMVPGITSSLVGGASTSPLAVLAAAASLIPVRGKQKEKKEKKEDVKDDSSSSSSAGPSGSSASPSPAKAPSQASPATASMSSGSST